MMAKFHYIDPYTEAWWKARRGMPTASQFHRIYTPGGKASDQSTGYMCELIAERLLQETMKKDAAQSYWVERGHQIEPLAIAECARTRKLILKRVGFVTSNDGRIGCSPDCLVQGSLEGVEIKCPAPWTQVGYLLYGPNGPGKTDQYKPQVQGQLLAGEFDAMHFFSYHPQMPAYHLKTYRDDNYINGLARALDRFCDVLDMETERARRLGTYTIVAPHSREESVV